MNPDFPNIHLGFIPSYRFGWTEWTAKMRQDSLEAFSHIPGIRIIVPQPSTDDTLIDSESGSTPHGAIHNLNEAEAVIAYFIHQGVDGLIICPLDFGDERSATKIAERLQIPVLLYATKEPPAPEHISMARVSDSYCGNLSIAAGLYRRKIPFHFAGIFFPDESTLLSEVDTFTRAVSIVKGLRNARIGQIGVRPTPFETVAYDEIAMVRKFGQNVVHVNLEEIVDKARNYHDQDPILLKTKEEICGSVRNITVSTGYLENASRLSLALESFWKENCLSAMAMQCWPVILRMLGISTCAVFGHLTGKGMLTACETDILGALSMLVNFRAALGEIPPHFVDWTIQHRDDPNRLLAWHCGNAPVCLAQNPQFTAIRSRHDMVGSSYPDPNDSQAGLYQFQLKPGKVTLCRLAEMDGDWKMLIAGGEIIPSHEILAGTWAWVSVRDHATLYRTLIEEGFIHHASMIHGNQVQALHIACKFLNIHPVIVE